MDGVASPRIAHGGDRGHVRSFDLVSWREGWTTRKMPPSLDVPGLEAVDLADSDMEPLKSAFTHLLSKSLLPLVNRCRDVNLLRLPRQD